MSVLDIFVMLRCYIAFDNNTEQIETMKRVTIRTHCEIVDSLDRLNEFHLRRSMVYRMRRQYL